MKSILSTALLCAAFLFPACNDDDDNLPATNDKDREFSMKASMSNYAEIDAGQLAVTKGSDPAITGYGQMMVGDHGASRLQLRTIAADLGLPVPDSLDAENAALKAQLLALSGRAFDSVYIHSQVAAHIKTIALFQDEMNNGRNDRLRNYAISQMPHLQEHLQEADSIAAFY